MRVSVVRADILSPIAQDLIRSLNAELSARYPEEGATQLRLTRMRSEKDEARS
jgi:hypothetical protein